MGQYNHTYAGEPIRLEVVEELVLQEMKRDIAEGNKQQQSYGFYLCSALWRIALEESPGRPAPPPGIYGDGDET